MNCEDKCRYVFIVGVPRSGTTLITKILANSLNACYLPKSLRILERFGLGGCFSLAKLMAKFSERYPYLRLDWHYHDGGSDKFWNNFKSIKCKEKRRIFLNNAAYPEVSAERVFFNKRIANVNQLELLAVTFPDATLLHIKRDPVDTIKSILNRRKKIMGSTAKRWGVFTGGEPNKSLSPIIDCAFQYRFIYEKIEDKKSLFSNFLTVNYEGFCATPNSQIKCISENICLKGCLVRKHEISRRDPSFPENITADVINVLSESYHEELKHIERRYNEK